jgi:hypothetical protein
VVANKAEPARMVIFVRLNMSGSPLLLCLRPGEVISPVLSGILISGLVILINGKYRKMIMSHLDCFTSGYWSWFYLELLALDFEKF